MAIYERLKSRNATLFAEVPPASPPALPAQEPASSTTDGCGQNSSNVAGELAPPGSWQKTLLESLAYNLSASSGSLGKWKRWDTKSCPLSLVLMTWERRTVDRGYSLWPTPTASDAKRRSSEAANGKLQRGAHTGWSLVDVTGFSPHPEFIEWLMGFPIGWTAHPLSVMQLSLEFPKSSDAE